MTESRTPQEDFWKGTFGDAYIARNQSQELLAANLSFFSRCLVQAGSIGSCIEFGANVGMNLRALQLLYPKATLKGVEINAQAASILAQWLGAEHVFVGPISAFETDETLDLVLIKGVLIHIHPDHLNEIYSRLYDTSRQWILIAEYYNPVPVMIPYRGHNDRLFKRDFAGEMLDRYPDLKLVDYGFAYHRDQAFPQDDINWFLLEKVRDRSPLADTHFVVSDRINA